MRKFSVNLKTTIIVVLLVVVSTLSILYSGLALYEHNQTVNSFASSLFAEKQNAIRVSLINRFNVQARLGNLAAQSIPDIYDNQGLKGVERYLFHNLNIFDEIAAAFFTTKNNEFTGYIHQKDFIQMYSNQESDYSIIFRKTNEFGYPAEILNKTPSFYATQRPWYDSALNQKTQGFSNVFTYHAFQTLALPHSLPVYDNTGELIGVIGTNIFLGEFAADLKEKMQAVNGVAIILDQQNRLIASSTDVSPLMQLESSTSMINANDSDNSFIKFAASVEKNNREDTLFEEGFFNRGFTVFKEQGKEYLTSGLVFEDISNLKWRVQLFIPRQEFTQNVTSFIIDFLLILVVILVFSVLISVRVSRLISHPISQMIARFSEFDKNNIQPSEATMSAFELKEVSALRCSEQIYKERIAEVINSLQISAAQNMKQLEKIQQLALVTQTVNEMFVIIGKNGTLGWANHRFIDYFHLQDCYFEAVGRPMFREELIPDSEFSHKLEQYYQRFVADNSLVSAKIHVSERHFELLFFNMPSPQESAKSLVMIRDITEQTRYENELLIWKQIFDSTPVGVGISLNNDDKINIVNPALANIFGGKQEDFRGVSIDTFYPPDADHQPDKILETVKEKGELTTEVEHVRKNGEKFPALLSVALVRNKESDIIARVALVSDMSEIKQIQQELFQSQKMQAIGTLAGGIVHDMNNVLAAIMGNAECGKFLNSATSDSEAERNTKFFNAIINAAERGAKLTQQILSFSRMEALVLHPINVFKLISDTVELLTATLPSNIQCTYVNVMPTDLCIEGNESQLQQVILNLLNNSVKAISKTDKESGVIRITTELQHNCLIIKVMDNGCGIDEKILPFLFDPFFTTETKGKGTGLGLAIVKRVVEAHKATINVASNPASGTCFTLKFSEYQLEKQECAKQNVPKTEQLTQTHIVFVDDNEELLEISVELFEANGIRVIPFHNAVKAQQYCLEHGEDIDCLISDFDMPQLTGDKLIQNLHKTYPNLKCIMTTGYSELLDEDKITSLSISKLLIKPVRVSELLAAVQQVVKQTR